VLIGVAVVGRPVARLLDDGQTLEVVPVATDGTRNACSLLYAAAWQAAKALGYRRMITYTRQDESGPACARPDGASWPPGHRVPAGHGRAVPATTAGPSIRPVIAGSHHRDQRTRRKAAEGRDVPAAWTQPTRWLMAGKSGGPPSLQVPRTTDGIARSECGRSHPFRWWGD
jgi:hypothetical protein